MTPPVDLHLERERLTHERLRHNEDVNLRCLELVVRLQLHNAERAGVSFTIDESFSAADRVRKWVAGDD